MRTADAVTPVPDLTVPLWVFGALYVLLAVMVVALLWRQMTHAPAEPAGAAP